MCLINLVFQSFVVILMHQDRGGGLTTYGHNKAVKD